MVKAASSLAAASARAAARQQGLAGGKKRARGGGDDDGSDADDGDAALQQQQQRRLTARKKLDARIPALIANGVQSNHRSFFVMVGDRGRDQVVTLHYLLAKARVSARPSVLWCYKKELGFS
ncbi:hypothetical protein HK405_001018, partial [Cladochytrium tenue]